MFGIFSFRRNNMRWFSWRRIFVVMLILPVFTITLIVNRVFMILDYLFFPFFITQKVTSPVFIVAAPRTATTFLFHLLTEQKEYFTSFRLWEIIFAPSVTQKYFWLFLGKIDHFLGFPVSKILRIAEARIFGKFRTIHLIGLNMPEEDEAILLWNMSTIYLNYFFPDTDWFTEYKNFDHAMPERKRKRINRYYMSCVKRHNYVFNRNDRKSFLSKNPVMMGKLKSLNEMYPDALILNINRCPSKVIPSTLALNRSIYRAFTPHEASQFVNKLTVELIVSWYKLAFRNLNQLYKERYLSIDFRRLILSDKDVLISICKFLDLPVNTLSPVQSTKAADGHVSSNRYVELSKDEVESILQEIPFMKEYCNAG